MACPDGSTVREGLSGSGRVRQLGVIGECRSSLAPCHRRSTGASNSVAVLPTAREDDNLARPVAGATAPGPTKSFPLPRGLFGVQDLTRYLKLGVAPSVYADSMGARDPRRLIAPIGSRCLMSSEHVPPIGTGRAMTAVAHVVAGKALPIIDKSVTASVRPFRTPEMIRPRVNSKYYGWTHYGVFFPSLPEPHRYCNVMTLLGTTGTVCFDNDYLVTGNPRQTATLLFSTAGVDVIQTFLRAMARQATS
jgi:hypothetical protein